MSQKMCPKPRRRSTRTSPGSCAHFVRNFEKNSASVAASAQMENAQNTGKNAVVLDIREMSEDVCASLHTLARC